MSEEAFGGRFALANRWPVGSRDNEFEILRLKSGFRVMTEFGQLGFYLLESS